MYCHKQDFYEYKGSYPWRSFGVAFQIGAGKTQDFQETGTQSLVMPLPWGLILASGTPIKLFSWLIRGDYKPTFFNFHINDFMG